MKSRTKRLMAYICMPLIFMITGYSLMALALSPFYDVVYAAANLVIASDRPDFSQELTSVFEGGDTNPTSVDISEIDIPSFGTHYAEINSSRIGLTAPVYWGDSYEIMRHGVGHFIGSFLPGFGGTMLMSAHNTTHFLPLQDIELGDLVEIRTNYGRFEYEVTDIQVLRYDDPSAFDLAQTEKELLVMYTCYPFGGIGGITGISPERLFVYAEKVSGPTVTGVETNG